MNADTEKRLAVTNIIYKVFSPEEFLGLPRWAKDSVTRAAERDYARMSEAAKSKKSKRFARLKKPMTPKRKKQLRDWAHRIAYQVNSKRDAEKQRQANRRR
nr:hypothetical protein [uncultured Ruegeria sp.]